MAGVEVGGSFGGRVVMDPQALATLLRGEQGPVFRRFTEAGDIVKKGAQRRVGVWKPASGEPSWSINRRMKARKPGTLRDSIVKRVTQGGPNGFTILVGSEDEIALFHHEGTRAHTIAPSTKPQLVFWSGSQGRVIRTMKVFHPGTRPNRYLTDSLADLRGMF